MKKYPKTVACMLWFGNRIMLAKRLDTHTFSGYYEAVGGKVEDTDEDIIYAIQREIKEEAGIYVYRYHLEIMDCITNDPTTEKCFIFRHMFVPLRFHDVDLTKERRKRTPWQLYTPEEALKLKLMPGLAENMKPGYLLA